MSIGSRCTILRDKRNAHNLKLMVPDLILVLIAPKRKDLRTAWCSRQWKPELMIPDVPLALMVLNQPNLVVMAPTILPLQMTAVNLQPEMMAPCTSLMGPNFNLCWRQLAISTPISHPLYKSERSNWESNLCRLTFFKVPASFKVPI